MNVYSCGFNGFRQIVDDSACIGCFTLKYLNLKNVRSIDFSWSCLVALSDYGIYLSGYSGERFFHLKRIVKPAPDIEFIHVSCGDKYALFTTLEGSCWQYSYAGEEWRRLPDFACVEVTQSGNCKNETAKSEDQAKATSAPFSSAAEPVNVRTRNGIKKTCCGSIVNIALDNLGQVYSIPSPIPMQGIRIVEVACGFEHSVMLDNMGRVYTCGYGMRGQLGNEVLETVETPELVNALGGLHVVKIAAGGWHSAVITQCGVLYTWGWNNAGQLGFPSIISDEMAYETELTCERKDVNEKQSFSLGNERSLKEGESSEVELDPKGGISNKGSYLCEGKVIHYKSSFKKTRVSNSDEVLDECANISSQDSQSAGEVVLAEESCDSEKSEDSSSSDDCVTVLAVPKAVDFPEDVNAVDVSCGNRHTVVLTDDGSVWACGWNAYGQLGKSPNALVFSSSMIKMDVLPGKIKAVQCGGWNSAVLME